MRKIIVLKGKANTGKTTTIKESLKQIFGIEVYYPKKDLAMLFRHKNKIVAIISWGEDLEKINRYFNKIKRKFDVLICSCRTKGETLKFYKDKCENHDVIFVEKKVNDNTDQIKVINEIKMILS